MVIHKISIPRRTFLHGAGAVVALPLLDAMTPAFAQEAKRPIRMAFMQTPNGIMNLKNEWTPLKEGADWEMTRTLEPLSAVRNNLVVLSGLDQQQAAGRDGEVGGDHPRACTAWLTGTHAKMTSGADLRAGISADQIAAKEFGKYTQLASLEIGLEFGGSRGRLRIRLWLRLLQHHLVGATRRRRSRWRIGHASSSSVSSATTHRSEGARAVEAGRPQHSRRDQCRREADAGESRRDRSQQDRPVPGCHPRRRAAHAAGREAGRPCPADRIAHRRAGDLLRLLPPDGRHHGAGVADRHDPRHHLPDGP